MILAIDLTGDTPIYQQLRNEIIRGITTGELAEGEGLPSVRQLGSDLGINLHTVNKAYDLLRKDGFITLHRQKGATVSPHSSIQVTDAFVESLTEQLTPLITEAKCRGMTQEEFFKRCEDIFLLLDTNKPL